MFSLLTKSDYGRFILTILLLVGVYTETGIFTTITLGLIAIGMELQSIVIKMVITNVN